MWTLFSHHKSHSPAQWQRSIIIPTIIKSFFSYFFFWNVEKIFYFREKWSITTLINFDRSKRLFRFPGRSTHFFSSILSLNVLNWLIRCCTLLNFKFSTQIKRSISWQANKKRRKKMLQCRSLVFTQQKGNISFLMFEWARFVIFFFCAHDIACDLQNFAKFFQGWEYLNVVNLMNTS